MENEGNPSKRHRGSSPPFQESSIDLLGGLKGIGPLLPKHSGPAKRRHTKENISLNLELNFEQTKEDGLLTEMNYTKQDKNDESRWQDDGGESG
jgi:hypothetical protein